MRFLPTGGLDSMEVHEASRLQNLTAAIVTGPLVLSFAGMCLLTREPEPANSLDTR
jgi:hypothetical protein